MPLHQDLADREALGVTRGATFAEVRKAYLKAALRHHPDKTRNGGTVEFVRLQQAYHRIVARLPCHVDRSDELPSGVEMPMGDYDNVVLSLPLVCSVAMHMVMMFWYVINRPEPECRVRARHQDHEADGKPETIIETITVTMDDVYHARVKKVVLNVRSRGGGYIHRKLLVPLLHHRSPYVFLGMGDEGRKDGDVQIHVKIAEDPSGVRLDDMFDPNDLHVSVPTSLYDFVYGRDIQLEHLPGGDVSFRYGGSETDPRSHEMVPGRGLPYEYDYEDAESEALAHGDSALRVRARPRARGNLYIFFDLQLPVRPSPLMTICSAQCRAIIAALSDDRTRGADTLIFESNSW